MNISTDPDFLGLQPDHPLQAQFLVLSYQGGIRSYLPHRFFRTWLDEEPSFGTFVIGRGSGLGVGSVVKYDSEAQCLRVGRYVAGGLRLQFLLNGQHDMRTLSTCMFSAVADGMRNAPPPQYGDSIIGHDVWLGDEVMMLGGGSVAHGCVIGARSLLPPNFRSEPYGIYVGAPARLVRFRFPEKVREALLALAWWDQPVSWLRTHNDAFLVDLAADPGRALETLAELARQVRPSTPNSAC
jgi:acetyltransferase-like isoleucine patch superfamily enzyme